MGRKIKRLRGVVSGLQTGWSIVGITLVLLIFLELTFRVMFAVRDRLVTVSTPDRRIVAEGYAGASWPVDHYRELERLQERWQPFVYFRQTPFHGKTINIDAGGVRATWNAPARPKAGRTVKILMLGGSSLWGFGARDDQTIPSLLARSLYEIGWNLELKNLAEIGYVSTQEVIALTTELQSGYRPDFVIFYDGVNDTTSALLEGEPGVTTNEINRRKEFNLLQAPDRLIAALAGKLVLDSGSYRFAQLARRRLEREPPSTHARSNRMKVPDVADAVVRYYEANILLVEALARTYRFRPLFFWQPTVFTKPSLVAVEQEETQRFSWAEPFMNDVYDSVRTATRLNSNPAFHDLSAIFDDTEGLVFIDYCHTTESANARIAAAMAATLIETQSRLPPRERPVDADRAF